jgi:hypothetical protein
MGSTWTSMPKVKNPASGECCEKIPPTKNWSVLLLHRKPNGLLV